MNILEEQVPLSEYAGPGHWNDPDMLEVGNEGMNFLDTKKKYKATLFVDDTTNFSLRVFPAEK